MKYSNQYSFFNSEKCIEEFLQNVKYRFHATSKKWFKCSFIIENTQNSIRADLQPLLNTRYWIAICFNEFIFHALKHDILKRVINNYMTGSSCYFKRFVYLAGKILDGEVEISI